MYDVKCDDAYPPIERYRNRRRAIPRQRALAIQMMATRPMQIAACRRALYICINGSVASREPLARALHFCSAFAPPPLVTPCRRRHFFYRRPSSPSFFLLLSSTSLPLPPLDLSLSFSLSFFISMYQGLLLARTESFNSRRKTRASKHYRCFVTLSCDLNWNEIKSFVVIIK